MAKNTSTTPTKAEVKQSAFMKKLKPSKELAAIVGDEPLPRSEVVKRLWEYIKKNNLQDASNKRIINADAKLEKVLRTKSCDMFQMTKLVSANLS